MHAPVSLGEFARQVRRARAEARAAADRAFAGETARVALPHRTPPRTRQPEAAEHDVVVRPGDSMWKLSRFYLGDGRLWTSLWRANPGVENPERIYPGQALHLPQQTMEVAAVEAPSQNLLSKGRSLVPCSIPRTSAAVGTLAFRTIPSQNDLGTTLGLAIGHLQVAKPLASREPARLHDQLAEAVDTEAR